MPDAQNVSEFRDRRGPLGGLDEMPRITAAPAEAVVSNLDSLHLDELANANASLSRLSIIDPNVRAEPTRPSAS
ncbi:hypothetical protein DL769_005823 [Monosporascus sp. CRB-8-3]|nr:hypothetical protein DL769_005823 [Monosporascus sp. CRB-8-3]